MTDLILLTAVKHADTHGRHLFLPRRVRLFVQGAIVEGSIASYSDFNDAIATEVRLAADEAMNETMAAFLQRTAQDANEELSEAMKQNHAHEPKYIHLKDAVVETRGGRVVKMEWVRFWLSRVDGFSWAKDSEDD